MSFDYRKLKGRIKERCDTQAVFADAVGLSENSLSLKLSGKVQFKQQEIASACDVLNIPYKDIPDYFFAEEVQ